MREFRLTLNRAPGMKIRGQSASTLKKNTQNYHLIALRSFLKYLMKRELLPFLLIGLIWQRLKNGARSYHDRGTHSFDESTRQYYSKGLRDKSLVRTLFSTGLRLSELCSLNRDLDLSKDEFSIRGKGEKCEWFFFLMMQKCNS